MTQPKANPRTITAIAERTHLPDPRPSPPTDPICLDYDELFQRWQELMKLIDGSQREN